MPARGKGKAAKRASKPAAGLAAALAKKQIGKKAKKPVKQKKKKGKGQQKQQLTVSRKERKTVQAPIHAACVRGDGPSVMDALRLMIPFSQPGTAAAALIDAPTANEALEALLRSGLLSAAQALLERRGSHAPAGPMYAGEVIKALDALCQTPPVPVADALSFVERAMAHTHLAQLGGNGLVVWVCRALSLVLVEWLAEAHSKWEAREANGGAIGPVELRLSPGKPREVECVVVSSSRSSIRPGDAVGLSVATAAQPAEMVEAEVANYFQGVLTLRLPTAEAVASLMHRQQQQQHQQQQ